MYYNEEKAVKACEDEPSLIFKLIREGQTKTIDKILSNKKFDINTTDSAGNDIITRLLKAKEYELVLKYMKRKDWDINHQNIDGNTFAHYLVSINYVHVIDIIKTLRRNQNFRPNIKNNKNETILDKSINENYIYTTLKVLEDNRFNVIDVVSFKKIYETYIKSNEYETYIKSNEYGKYSKVNNLQMIIKSLDKKDELLPTMQQLIEKVKSNMSLIKKEIMLNKSKYLEYIINDVLVEEAV